MPNQSLLATALPSIGELRRLTQSLAMLDAIICPEWESRYYSFNCNWSAGEAMASMRNGCGDDWFLLFCSAGAALKGFAHELASGAQLAQSIQSMVPKEFSSFLQEPAFSMSNATFCYWCLHSENLWKQVPPMKSDDGSHDLLELLIAGPSAYQAWTEEYYEVPVALEVVTAVLRIARSMRT
jgi:hypothetical protein